MIEFETSSKYYINIAKAYNAGQFDKASEILKELNKISLKKKVGKTSYAGRRMIITSAGTHKKVQLAPKQIVVTK